MRKLLKHYRGGLYCALLSAKAATDMVKGDNVLVYVSLQDGELWVRPASSFSEVVRFTDSVAVVPSRFSELSPVEAETEIKYRNRRLGVKPRGWKPRAKRRK